MQVPQYQRQVVQQTLPDVQIPQNNVRKLDLMQEGEAQQRFGNSIENDASLLAQQQEKMQLQQNAIAIQSAKNDAVNSMNTLMYDPDKGLLNTQGVNAQGASAAANAGMQGIYADAMKNVGDNPMRQQGLQEELSPLMDAYQRMADEHQFTQTQIAQKETNDAGNQQLTNMFVLAAPNTVNVVGDDGKPVLDADGNQEKSYLADAPMRSMIANNTAYLTSIGTPTDAISESNRQLATSAVGQAVKSLINNQDFTDANNVLERYGHDPTKMDAEDYSAMHEGIQKAEAPITSRNAALNYLKDTGGDPYKAIRNVPLNDPNYSTITQYIKAYASDIKGEQTKQQQEFVKQVAAAAWGFTTAQQAVDYVTPLVQNGSLTAEQGEAIISRTQKKLSATQSPDQKWAVSFESNGLSKALTENDDLSLQESQGIPLTQAQIDQRTLNNMNLTRYWTISQGGTWDPQTYNDNTDRGLGALNACYQRVSDLVSKGESQNDIENDQNLLNVLNALGVDKDTFFGNCDWR